MLIENIKEMIKVNKINKIIISKEKRATNSDIANEFKLNEIDSAIIGNHLRTEIKKFYTINPIEHISQLTFGQKCFVNYFICSYHEVPEEKLSISISNRIERNISQQLLTKIKNSLPKNYDDIIKLLPKVEFDCEDLEYLLLFKNYL